MRQREFMRHSHLDLGAHELVSGFITLKNELLESAMFDILSVL